jgi:acyl-CoA reductase-like NAD-dependent aldehyde dehydrogenase
MSFPAMTIAGRQLPADAAFSVINPATGQEFAQAPDCSDEQLDAAVDAARSAFREWRRDESLRCDLMARAAAALDAATDELAALLTTEQGKPIGDAAIEIGAAGDWLRYYSALEIRPHVLQDDENARIEVRRQAIGPVAAITPWNFPIGLAFWKVAPALRAGNTLVLKPSPFTPLTSLRVGEILSGVLPAGVLNVISGRDPLGAKLAAHPGIRKISFTGSTATGKKVAATAAEDLKRVTLELGGNDPAIVLDDADPEAVAASIFRSAMANSGQICMAVKRVYVPRRMYGVFVEGLVAQAGLVKVGDGFAAGVTHGPVNNAPQFARVAGLVDEAIRAGAKPAAGGRATGGPGYFYNPTILTDVTDEMGVVAEEQFGPVLPVLPYDEVEEAVERANRSHYGLGSSIWTADVERGARIAEDIEAGTTWVNSHLKVSPAQPFGGVKWSGVGVENGLEGLHEFTDVHVVHLTRGAAQRPKMEEAS